MTQPSPPERMLFTRLVTASRVTVIPIAADGLIAVSHGAAGGWCGFPTAIKAHPRIRAQSVAVRLLARDLRCQHADLRLAAVLDPQPGHPHRQAVYTATVTWPHGRPDTLDPHQPRLHTITSLDQAREVGLRLGPLAELLPGPDLATAARNLPELSTHPTSRS